MANTNTPYGLMPVRNGSGAPWNGQATMYRVKQADTTTIYIGDPVASVGTADANGIADVTLATAGSAIRGVVVGIKFNPSDLTQKYLPGTKAQDYYVYVVDDPNAVFMAQEVNGTAMTQANVGQNANFKIVAPSATYQLSASGIDSSTVANTATLNLKLLGLAQLQNNAFGSYAQWLVRINNHELAAGTGTVGI